MFNKHIDKYFGDLIKYQSTKYSRDTCFLTLKLILSSTKHQNSIIYTINTCQISKKKIETNFLVNYIFSENKYKIYIIPPNKILKPQTKP